jgi:phenylalanyl-tRNA synthetase alpha chain
MPPVSPWIGRRHPILRTADAVVDAFVPLGFTVRDLSLLATVADSFDALAYRDDHPVRTTLSFSPEPSIVLRTHATSGVPAALRDAAPDPFRMLLTGFCFRNEAPTSHSNFQFLQLDGIVVQPDLGLHHLRGLFGVLVAAAFGAGHRWRVRPCDFPFTSPGFALEVICPWCEDGCSICRGRAWSEVGAGGLLTDALLASAGYDPGIMQAVSFGCSIERLLQLRHGLEDIRPLLRNDPELSARLDVPGP